MFGSLGVPELLLIFVVVLIVFGPRRIPEIGRTLGRALGEFRKATDDLKGSIEREVRLEELKKIAPPVSFDSLASSFDPVSRTEPPAPAEASAETEPSSATAGSPPAADAAPTAEAAAANDEPPTPSRSA